MIRTLKLLLICSLAISISCAAQSTGGLKIGDVAPDFRLINIDETFITLADYKDAKGYIVVFTCNHCPFSVMYEDRLIALHNKYAPMGYPVVAINPNDPAANAEDSFELMQVRAKEKSFPFAYLFDDGQKTYPQYGATKTPHVFLLDQDKTVQYIGAIDDSPRDEEAIEVVYLENAIKALMNNKTPEPTMTKAIGCGIKTKS